MSAVGSRSSLIAALTYTTSAETTGDVIGSDLIMMKTHRAWFGLTIAMILAMLCSSALRAADNSTPQQVFDGMRQSFQADKAKGVHAKYQWELSGSNGGGWRIEETAAPDKKGRGETSNPT